MTAFDPTQVLHKLTSRLRVRQLMLLMQIEQHGSITRAAEHMSSSQPAVTQALAELEDLFGTPLFDRSARGMTPTPLGRLVLMCARGIAEDLGHLVGDIEAALAGRAAHIHLGVVPFVPSRLLASAIERTRSDGGQRISVTLHEGTSEHLLSRLQDHKLDVVIGRASSTLDATQVSMEVLYRQPPRLIAGRRLAARLSRVRPDWRRLAELDWILGAPHTPMREQVASIFLDAGIAPPVPLTESYSSRLIGEMVAAGERAVSIVPADIADELVRVAGVSVVPYTLEWSLPPVALFQRARGRRVVDQVFADSLHALLRETYPS
ncbi:LysR family transcriptional regulator [Paraburkholderia caballeronis]|uniref:DNA-binding transcriptional regulator, LysR family n=1 Tax=Paraburkholderia caballeronis TaxID=416943 RepID=A0A1H7M369_9BURK|nr:LysR family transcriptional regulator [Paraburkholderia caballeronis]PXW28704.1 LysR family transcriptional regulator [Paraburkholderia caballeronis]PXX04070.1 LysR family transcriptional regulator [Paraburkholderia caballeronis]RAK04814.1 LysR family transcriptional regulator [Paraburkholderia caballeronis]TDV19715.1 LysR family transcriptional regulator [Paraburkholderia caballeronis]TDV22314.1 LysR family transcriptional regulator [Paraburkholderia caballeronis]